MSFFLCFLLIMEPPPSLGKARLRVKILLPGSADAQSSRSPRNALGRRLSIRHGDQTEGIPHAPMKRCLRELHRMTPRKVGGRQSAGSQRIVASPP